MQSKNKFLTFVVVILVLALCASWFIAPSSQVSASPAEAVLTPVSNNNSNNGVRNVTFFNGAITADTYSCFDLGAYDVMDLQYQIDQTVVNTVTLTMQRYNIAMGPSTPVYESGATVVSANAADAHGDLQVSLFDRYTCVLADVTNSNSLTLRVVGSAK